MLKLNIGCGNDIKEGFINIDVKKEFGNSIGNNLTFLVCNISKGLPFKNSTFDFVLAQDILEHFDKYLFHVVLSEIIRVLKINGIIQLRVPDFEIILNEITNKKLNFFDMLDLIYGEPLIASEIYTGSFGIHKWGFSKKSLKIIGKKFGIDFKEIKNIGFNIEAIGVKVKEIKREDIEKIKITSWGNRVGKGKPYITLKEFIEGFYNEN